MRDFREFKVWERAHQLALAIYRDTRSFPREELYGLTSQVRRAAVSIPANIAEGCCRGGDAEFARFLGISMGSASELDYHLLLARDLTYLVEPQYRPLLVSVSEVKKMLASLIGKIRTDI